MEEPEKYKIAQDPPSPGRVGWIFVPSHVLKAAALLVLARILALVLELLAPFF